MAGGAGEGGVRPSMLRAGVESLLALFEEEGLRTPLASVAERLLAILGPGAVFVTGRRGRLLAWAVSPGQRSDPVDPHALETGTRPDHLAAAFLRLEAPAAGAQADALTGVAHSLVLPVRMGGRRLGTLLVVRPGAPFDDDEVALAEVGALGAGLLLAAALSEEEEGEAKERQRARAAVRSLSYSEAVAVHRLLDALKGDEGLLVTSRIADQAGITRSIVVNALRKLASAGVVEARSLGAKGTYLRVLNRELRRELSRQRLPHPGSEALRRQA